MSASPPSVRVASLPGLPGAYSLDSTFGAVLAGTYVALILYGLTVHQAFRYFRIYKQDVPRLKGLVYVLLLADTVYVALCMHACYFYLVKSYFKPHVLLSGIWSIRLLAPMTGVIIILSQSFYSRRASLIGSKWYKILIATVVVLMLGEVGFTIAATVDAFVEQTFARWREVTWMVTGGFAIAVVVDGVLCTALIVVLRRSRTGFKRTDTVLDILVVYTINTGLLTGTFSVLSLILAVVSPDDLIYLAFNMVTTMLYSNSMLAVLNSRRFLAQRATAAFGTGNSMDLTGSPETERGPALNFARNSLMPQLPDRRTLEIKFRPHGAQEGESGDFDEME